MRWRDKSRPTCLQQANGYTGQRAAFSSSEKSAGVGFGIDTP